MTPTIDKLDNRVKGLKLFRIDTTG